MKNIKRLGLTLIMLLTTSSFALAQESEVVMTKEELSSFLEKVAEARRSELRSNKKAQLNSFYKNSRRGVNTNRLERQDESRVMYQLDRINDRIDNLFMLHAGAIQGNGSNSTIVTPGSSNLVPANTNATDAARIQELQRELDALKAQYQDDVAENKSNLTDLEQRILDAKTPEERRDALKDLLAKFKNFKKQVFFANDSDKLSTNDLSYINDVTDVLNKYPELSIVLEGWASPRGNANYNKQLSMRRSESVERALLDKGISAERIVSSFKGEDHSTSEAGARRVDMTVILK
ncbi:MAG: OmpA family protein [Weeksellaceae bacterium]